MAKTGTPTGPSSRLTRPQLRRVERYWLCDECAEAWTLVHDRKEGILLVPLPRAAGPTVGMKEEYRESA